MVDTSPHEQLSYDQALCSVNSCIKELSVKINSLASVHAIDVEHLRTQNDELKEQQCRLQAKIISFENGTGVSMFPPKCSAGCLPFKPHASLEDDGDMIPPEVYHRSFPYNPDVRATPTFPGAGLSRALSPGNAPQVSRSRWQSDRYSMGVPDEFSKMRSRSSSVTIGAKASTSILPIAQSPSTTSARQYSSQCSEAAPMGKEVSFCARFSAITPEPSDCTDDEPDEEFPKFRASSMENAMIHAPSMDASMIPENMCRMGTFELCEMLREDISAFKLSSDTSQHTLWMFQREFAAKKTKSFDDGLDKPRYWTLKPTSWVRMVWESSGAVMLLFDTLLIPMQVFSIPRNDFLEVMGWFTLLYWTLDIFLSCVSGFYSSDGVLVMEPRQVVSRYLRTWFFLDILIVGVDWFPMLVRLAAAGDSSTGLQSSSSTLIRIAKVMRMLRFMRLLRIMKLTRSNFILMVQERMESIRMYVFSNLTKNVIFIIIINHFCACGWYGVGSIPPSGEMSWIKHYEIETRPWVYQYLTSFHWSMAQFANGEILVEPQNVPERLYSIFVLLASMVVFSSFIAIVGNTVHQLIQQRSSQHTDQYVLRLYLRQNGISLDLRMRVNRYVGVKLMQTHNTIKESDVKLFDVLSRPLQAELHTELYLETLISHQFFSLLSRASASIVRSFCSHATRRVHLALGDTLFSFGEDTACMYFVETGTMYYSPQRNDREVSMGDWFCEAALWAVQWLTVGRMSAMTECEMLALDRSAIHDVMARYHTTNMRLPREYAVAFIHALNVAHKDGILSDVHSDLVNSVFVQNVLYAFDQTLKKYELKANQTASRLQKRMSDTGVGLLDKIRKFGIEQEKNGY